MKKLKSKSGLALIFFVLISGIIAVSISIVVYGYQIHLRQAKLMFDQEEVNEAISCAKVAYLQSPSASGVTYYYDEVTKEVYDASSYKGRVPIAGYGRSAEKDNRKGQTGAAGIPNKGGRDGAQFLAIAVESDSEISARWQGPVLTEYDYDLMTRYEKLRLTDSQMEQIEADRKSRGEQ
ncbi:MAG: hypothetical protein U0L49_09175 [Eubacterium sp.]|nr:hypothetical protein [Eubacterium sp.]